MVDTRAKKTVPVRDGIDVNSRRVIAKARSAANKKNVARKVAKRKQVNIKIDGVKKKVVKKSDLPKIAKPKARISVLKEARKLVSNFFCSGM